MKSPSAVLTACLILGMFACMTCKPAVVAADHASFEKYGRIKVLFLAAELLYGRRSGPGGTVTDELFHGVNVPRDLIVLSREETQALLQKLNSQENQLLRNFAFPSGLNKKVSRLSGADVLMVADVKTTSRESDGYARVVVRLRACMLGDMRMLGSSSVAVTGREEAGVDAGKNVRAAIRRALRSVRAPGARGNGMTYYEHIAREAKRHLHSAN